MDLGFPLGIRLTHAFNVVFLTLLIRSGIEILGGHPMLYFNEHCRPGSEWIRFTSQRMFRNLRWTAEDEKQSYTPWVALPGRDNLGLGRFWHFVAVIGWLLTGLIYLAVLSTTEQWQRLVPTSWGATRRLGRGCLWGFSSTIADPSEKRATFSSAPRREVGGARPW
jgi:methionine sulfoxide reductase catalytic subunit